MHHRPPGRSERRIVPRQLETTLEVDDEIVRIGRARSIRRSRSAPLVGARAAMRRVFIHGSYFPDIFIGLLLCGLGIGLAFVTATVAALAGVAEHEAGLASGLSNTAVQTGTALGVAIVTTVALSRSQHYLAADNGANRRSRP
jgi:predicted MFS family arabinose efflux permease